VSVKTDAGQTLAAVAAAWLVIHGAAAGTRREPDVLGVAAAAWSLIH